MPDGSSGCFSWLDKLIFWSKYDSPKELGDINYKSFFPFRVTFLGPKKDTPLETYDELFGIHMHIYEYTYIVWM